MIPVPNQIRAARGLCDWTVAELAKKVGVGTTTISAIETGRSAGSLEVMTAIVYAFRNAGVELTEDGGVRPRQSRIVTLNGHKGFCAFFDDIYEAAKTHPQPDMCVSNVREISFERWLGSYDLIHRDRMQRLEQKHRVRALIQIGDDDVAASAYADYRWVAKEHFADLSFYLYGDKTAFIEFSDEDVTITIVDNAAVTHGLRKMFDQSWNSAATSARGT
jgi:DNA-binding XRE family transcriptional regulator